MPRITIDHSGKHEPESEIERLKRRWLRKTGERMPLSIEAQTIEFIRDAVRRTERGETVFIPGPPRSAVKTDSDSMLDWDGHNNF